MAPTTVGSELSVMDIVARMAIAAKTAESGLHFQGLPVAGVAADGTVCAVENECSLCIVIETPLGPVDG